VTVGVLFVPHLISGTFRSVTPATQAVRASKGGAVRVTEDAISAATLELASMGMYTEPTCAQAGAKRKRLFLLLQ
jgi:hypothetical protein